MMFLFLLRAKVIFSIITKNAWKRLKRPWHLIVCMFKMYIDPFLVYFIVILPKIPVISLIKK
jgi:hypothetical protein